MAPRVLARLAGFAACLPGVHSMPHTLWSSEHRLSLAGPTGVAYYFINTPTRTHNELLYCTQAARASRHIFKLQNLPLSWRQAFYHFKIGCRGDLLSPLFVR